MKNIVSFVIIAVVIAAGSFYGGMHYGKNQANNVPLGNGQMGANRTRGMGGTGNQRGFAGGQGAGIVNGSVVNASASSLTIKLRDGGSRIVLFSSSTAVSKQAAGSVVDVKAGSEIMVVGSTNSDGSITASSIQLRPASSTRPF